MKLQVHSDLHIEFADVTITNRGADALLLAGDIGTFGGKRDLREWLRRHCDLFAHVLMIPGNHEYYGSSVEGVESVLEGLELPGFIYLQKKAVTIEGVKFAGATLWTDMNRDDKVVRLIASRAMNDYRTIYLKDSPQRLPQNRLSTRDTMALHQEHCEFLANKADIDVVMTHHLPTMQSHSVEAHGDDELKWAYGSDKDDLIAIVNPQLWIHGHTHLSKDYGHNPTGVRILSNPRGYQAYGYEEATGWQEELVIEIQPRQAADRSSQ